jgi:hypothetical protein
MSKNIQSSQDALLVKIVPWGPSAKKINSLTAKLYKSLKVKDYLRALGAERNTEGKKETKVPLRLLSFELLQENPISHRVVLPRLYRAKYYDYQSNCSIIVKANLGKTSPSEVVVSQKQPLPNSEEFEEALRILEKERDIGEALRKKVLMPYRPMPPVIIQENVEGEIERTLCVGLRPPPSDSMEASSNSLTEFKHEIVAVNMVNESTARFENKAPRNSMASDSFCGSPDANQPSANRGTPGSAKVTVKQGGTLLWDFVVTRPAASSGTNGSGIELQYLNYKGKRVLRRANVPILNVKYDNDACGPYRDWQYQESMIEATGEDVAPGFRLCPTVPKTVLDTGNDQGNFLGVGVYVEGQEVVLVSEMEAGW